MKTIGLLGGMSWESTVLYYQYINRRVAERLGGLHSASIVMTSFDFHGVEALQRQGRWQEAGVLMADAAVNLQNVGAEIMVICANTMHKVAPQIESCINIPLLHITKPTGDAIRRRGYKRVGLLGTRFTMEDDFYRQRLEAELGISVLTPEAAARDVVHGVIYDELCRGVVSELSRERFKRMITEFGRKGAEAVILGCTEISLLLKDKDASLPLLDTTRLHALAAADLALQGHE
jgi:aspartate racemase